MARGGRGGGGGGGRGRGSGARGRGRGRGSVSGSNSVIYFDYGDDAPLSNNRGSGRGRGRGGARGGYDTGFDFEQHRMQQRPGAGDPCRGRVDGGGGYAGRGRGRGRGGGSMLAQSQHAVSFDYTSLAPRSRVEVSDVTMELQHAAVEQMDDDDIAVEPRRGYQHVVKPHLENDERTPPGSPNEDHTPYIYVPNSAETSGRASLSAADQARLERIRTGQLNVQIPTGPRNPHSRFARRLEAPQEPLPVFKATSSKKNRSAFRPMEDPLEDACIGGIPRSIRKHPPGSRFDREGPIRRFEGEHRLPPTFVKAHGEWRDGAWTRTEEGGPDIDSLPDAVQHASGDHGIRQGLGYAVPPPSPKAEKRPLVEPQRLPDELFATFDEPNAGQDAFDKLLEAFPGSSIIEEGGQMDATLGWYQAPVDLGQPQAANKSLAIVAEDEASSQQSKKVNLEEDDGDEEIILVAPSSRKGGTPELVDVVQNAASPIDHDGRTDDQSEDGFLIDTLGDQGGEKTKIQYHTAAVSVIGEQSTTVVEDKQDESHDWQSDKDTKMANVPLSNAQLKKKAKENRATRKRASRRGFHVGGAQGYGDPREDDSDLEWGSDGPPGRKVVAEQEVAMQRLHLENNGGAPQTPEEAEAQLAIALANSMTEGSPKRNTGRASQLRRESNKDAILQDYMENALRQDNDDDEEMQAKRRENRNADQQTELDAMLRFMHSLDGQTGGRQITMDDIAIEQQLRDEEDWMTESSEGESGDGHAEASDAADERAFDEAERQLAAERGSSSGEPDIDDDSEEGKDDVVARESILHINGSHRVHKGAANSGEDGDEDDDDEDSDDEGEDDGVGFNGKLTWADADEDFIARLDSFAKVNDGNLKGRDRALRKKLFRAIERGDFDLLDGGFSGGLADMEMLNDPIVCGESARKAKATKPMYAGDPNAEKLRQQWERDRAKKADNKRKRAEQRALDAQNPYHNTNGKGKGANKKALKKAARAARRAEAIGEISNSGHDISGGRVDMVDALFGGYGIQARDGPLARHATSIMDVDAQILLFLQDPGKSTLSLAPMDKRARAQVHQLANCYNLVSKSKSSGSNRFPILSKNSRSGVGVQRRRIEAILRTSGGKGFGKGSRTGAYASELAGRKTRETISLPRNQEGAEVGFGADRIGADNVGHRLLMAMGWTEGAGVGATQGMAEPVGATIKITKGGLGF